MCFKINFGFLLIGLLPIVLCAFKGDLGAHDPTLIRAGKCYHIMGTGGMMKKLCNDDATGAGSFLHPMPNWIKAITGTLPNGIWAPDINFFNDQYYVYYAAAIWNKPNCTIGVATSKNVDGPFIDQGEVVHNTEHDDFSAIDPEIAWEYEGGKKSQLWLVFGSHHKGIYARKLDQKTGKPSKDDSKMYWIGGHSIEGSSTAYKNGYYYLFGSAGSCCNGVKSTYHVVVGRSQKITGPYLDKKGVDMVKGGGTVILQTHDHVHGPGGEDVYLDGDTHRMIYHYYDANHNGAPTFDIVDLEWSADHWPSVGAQSKLNYS